MDELEKKYTHRRDVILSKKIQLLGIFSIIPVYAGMYMAFVFKGLPLLLIALGVTAGTLGAAGILIGSMCALAILLIFTWHCIMAFAKYKTEQSLKNVKTVKNFREKKSEDECNDIDKKMAHCDQQIEQVDDRLKKISELENNSSVKNIKNVNENKEKSRFTFSGTVIENYKKFIIHSESDEYFLNVTDFVNKMINHYVRSHLSIFFTSSINKEIYQRYSSLLAWTALNYAQGGNKATCLEIFSQLKNLKVNGTKLVQKDVDNIKVLAAMYKRIAITATSDTNTNHSEDGMKKISPKLQTALNQQFKQQAEKTSKDTAVPIDLCKDLKLTPDETKALCVALNIKPDPVANVVQDNNFENPVINSIV